MKSVLIIDDDKGVRNSMVAFFEDCDWQVTAASSAEEALQMLVHETPDSVVVDILLPGMDGNAFILEATQKCPLLACVIVTGSPEYRLPQGILEIVNVSKKIYLKPIQQLKDLENELIQQIKICQASNSNPK